MASYMTTMLRPFVGDLYGSSVNHYSVNKMSGVGKMSDRVRKVLNALGVEKEAQPDIEATPPLPEAGADPYAAYQRRRKRSGRAQTILTGSLSPTDIGKRTLLG